MPDAALTGTLSRDNRPVKYATIEKPRCSHELTLI